MRYISACLLVFILFCSSKIFCQKTGELRVITKPTNAIIRLDTTLLKSNQVLELDKGIYSLKIWAPKRKFYEKSVTIIPDSSFTINHALVYENQYLEFLRAKKKYKAKRFTLRVIPTTLFLGLSFASYVNVNNKKSNLDTRYNRVIDSQNAYDNAIHYDDIVGFRNNFNAENDAYDKELNKLNQAKWIMYGTIGIGTAACWYFIRKSIKLEKPSYEEKTLLSNLNLNYNRINNTNTFQLTYNF